MVAAAIGGAMARSGRGNRGKFSTNTKSFVSGKISGQYRAKGYSRAHSATPWSGRCTGLLNQAGDQRKAMAKVSKSVTAGLLGIMDPSQEAPQEQA